MQVEKMSKDPARGVAARWLIRTFFLLSAVWIAAVIGISIFQNVFLVFPKARTAVTPGNFKAPYAEVSFKSEDGLTLNGRIGKPINSVETSIS